jgi:hypothetical protein
MDAWFRAESQCQPGQQGQKRRSGKTRAVDAWVDGRVSGGLGKHGLSRPTAPAVNAGGCGIGRSGAGRGDGDQISRGETQMSAEEGARDDPGGGLAAQPGLRYREQLRRLGGCA